MDFFEELGEGGGNWGEEGEGKGEGRRGLHMIIIA